METIIITTSRASKTVQQLKEKPRNPWHKESSKGSNPKSRFAKTFPKAAINVCNGADVDFIHRCIESLPTKVFSSLSQ